MGAARADGGSNCQGQGGLWGENERAWGLATGREGLSHERRRVAHPDGKGKGRKERTECEVKKYGGKREGDKSRIETRQIIIICSLERHSLSRVLRAPLPVAPYSQYQPLSLQGIMLGPQCRRTVTLPTP